jgi:transglutaminase-like putative cysteine protease
MPFGRFQFILFWVFQVLVLAWQWPMWPPLALAFFAVVALGVWKTLPEQPAWPGLLAATAVVSGALAFLPFSREHALFGLFLVAGWIFLWRRQNVTDYLLVFILGISQTFLLLLVRPDALSRGLWLSPLFFPVFVAAVFFLVLRHDMETHYIVKHRLGRQSRRVEVGRLLQSRRVLDAPMLGLILGTGLGVTALALVAGWAAAPALGGVRLRPAAASDFPPTLDVARLGRPVVTGRAQLTVRGETRVLKQAVYWRGQVHDRLDDGVWRRAMVSGVASGGSASGSPDCVWLQVTLENAALSDGYAPLFPRAVRPESAARLSNDHRVRLSGDLRTYEVCVGPAPAGVAASPGVVPPPLATVPLSGTLAGWADRVVSPGAGFEANVAAVLRFLEGYDYDEAYPRPPPGRDPLVHFLAFEKAGPCGLFASVTVAFLTRAGIPARLITGFSHGRTTGDARRFSDADAHSWVEAWHPSRGWVTLDPTRSARLALRARRPRDPARLALGWIAVGSLPSFALLFWAGLLLARRRAARLVPVRPAPAPARKISQTTLEAQLLFQELVSGPQFKASPRQAGEAAMAYARRLSEAGHPRARDVGEAAELAGRILFSRVSIEEKIEFLDRLRRGCRGQN